MLQAIRDMEAQRLPLVACDETPWSVKARAELRGIGSQEHRDDEFEAHEDHCRIRETKSKVKSHCGEFDKHVVLQSGEEEDSNGNLRIRAKLSDDTRVTSGKRSVRRTGGSRGARQGTASLLEGAAYLPVVLHRWARAGTPQTWAPILRHGRRPLMNRQRQPR